MCVRTSVRTYVHMSTKSFSDSNEIWYSGRGRWVIHDGMPYGLIQNQGQGHVALKVRFSISSAILMGDGKWLMILKPEENIYIWLGWILMSFIVFVSCDSVWFTLTETEISVNGKKLIPLTETKTETKKLRKTETKRKRKSLKRKLINLAISVFVSVVFPFRDITHGSGHLVAAV